MSPLWSILTDHVHSDEQRPIRFFYGARTRADLFMLDEIAALATSLPDFKFIPALSDAADSPLEIARAAAVVASLGAELALTGNTNLTGDAITGVALAEAACCAAARLTEINLARVPSDPRLDEAAGLTRQASAARAKALGGTDGTQSSKE